MKSLKQDVDDIQHAQIVQEGDFAYRHDEVKIEDQNDNSCAENSRMSQVPF